MKCKRCNSNFIDDKLCSESGFSLFCAAPEIYYQNKTHVVNLYKEDYDVYIGRAGKGQDGYFGNPVKLNHSCAVCAEVHMSSGSTIDCFIKYFKARLDEDKEYKKRVLELSGKTLGCFCKPKDCHGDIIAEWLNERLMGEIDNERKK